MVKYNKLLLDLPLDILLDILLDFTMPAFVACSICQKNGVITVNGGIQECPCCGPTARRRLNIPSFINQIGWTTTQGINNYYTQLAINDAKILFAQKTREFLQANIGISKSQLKKRICKLELVCMNVAKAKYPFMQD